MLSISCYIRCESTLVREADKSGRSSTSKLSQITQPVNIFHRFASDRKLRCSQSRRWLLCPADVAASRRSINQPINLNVHLYGTASRPTKLQGTTWVGLSSRGLSHALVWCQMITICSVRRKSNQLFFCHFSATLGVLTWNFIHLGLSLVHTTTLATLKCQAACFVMFNYCKVTGFFCKTTPPGDFCTSKYLSTEKTHAYWKTTLSASLLLISEWRKLSKNKTF